MVKCHRKVKMMKKILFVVVLLLLQCPLFAASRKDVICFSEQGKIKTAISKYQDYCLEKGKHEPRLLEKILPGFLRNTDSKYGYATRRDASQIIVSEVREGKRSKDTAEKIFGENLSFPDTGVKVNAVRFLILLGYKGKDLLPALKEGLYKGNAAVSLDSALLLGSLKYGESVSLLEEGIRSSNPLVAVASARGLGEIGGERAAYLLISGLKGRITSGGKAGSEALKNIPFSGSISIHTTGQMRPACASALGNIGGRDAILTLGSALGSQDKKLRQSALSALGKIALRVDKKPAGGEGLKGYFRRWFKKEVTPLPYIKSALEDWALKRKAAEILLELGEKEGTDFFKEKLAKGKIEERLSAASLLAGKGNKDGLEVIGNALKNPDKKVRIKAVKSLKNFGSDALPFLRKASHDSDPAVRKQVISTARSLGEKGEEITVALTRDSDSGVRKKASFAYAGIALTGEPVLDFLMEQGLFGLKVKSSDLAKLKKRDETIMRIKQVLNSLDKYGRVELAEILLYLGEKQTSVPILKDALTWHQAPRYQKKAAFALADIKDSSCLPFLEERFFKYGYAEVEVVKALLDVCG